MPIIDHRVFKALLPVALLSLASAVCNGQNTTVPPAVPATPPPPERSMEALNLVGGATSMPAISDSVLGVESGFRRALFSQGLLFRVNVLPRTTFNLLDAPVPAAEQVYIGQRPTWITGLNPILTADLRQLGLRNAQLNIGFGWRWTNWNPAGPKMLALSSMYLFKMWADRRVEIKAGYIGNDLEFVGLQIGGSTSTGAVGVYAVLPNEVGMSYFPLVAPSFNVRIRGPRRTYLKAAAQRSLDPGGGAATEARNHTGFRFVPKGSGLLLINEAGYQRASSAVAHQAWFRTGFMRNSTPYTNRVTGQKESGNYCAYALMDYQVLMSDPQHPSQGLFVGGTAMTVPDKFNPYDRYYEARVYQRAPLQSRPDDIVSLVASYRNHSRHFTDRLAGAGKSVWRSSASLASTYSIHVAHGNYLSLGLSYQRGPAITPRVADTFTFTANWGLYL